MDKLFALRSGKHKGKTIEWLEEHDSKYLDWIKENQPKMLLGSGLSGKTPIVVPPEISVKKPYLLEDNLGFLNENK